MLCDAHNCENIADFHIMRSAISLIKEYTGFTDLPRCVGSNVCSTVISTGFELASSVIQSCGDTLSVCNLSVEPALFEVKCFANTTNPHFTSSAASLISDNKFITDLPANPSVNNVKIQ